jgi:hypothetical protein
MPRDHPHVVAVGAGAGQATRDIFSRGAIVDAVFSATSSHWIDPRAQVHRLSRLLKAGGLLAILDLTQVDSKDDHGFFTSARPALRPRRPRP